MKLTRFIYTVIAASVVSTFVASASFAIPRDGQLQEAIKVLRNPKSDAQPFYKAALVIAETYSQPWRSLDFMILDVSAKLEAENSIHLTLTKAANAALSGRLNPLAEVTNEISESFRTMLDVGFIPSQWEGPHTRRNFTESGAGVIRARLAVVALFAQAYSMMSNEHLEIHGPLMRDALLAASVDMFKSVHQTLSITNVPFRRGVAYLNPALAEFAPNKETRLVFAEALALAETETKYAEAQALAASQREKHVLPDSRRLAYLGYILGFEVVNIVTWELASGSANPGYWMAAVNAILVYRLWQTSDLVASFRSRSKLSAEFRQAKNVLSSLLTAPLGSDGKLAGRSCESVFGRLK